jgi:2-haloacid dehalogenase
MDDEIAALTFDVFGTLVDWRSGVAREAEAVLAPKGHHLDWGGFADRWRALYAPSMSRVSRGEEPFVQLDVLHRRNLLEVLAEDGVHNLSENDVDHLSHAWRRLDPWPDVLAGMARLKQKFVLANLSNGSVALSIAMARHAGFDWDVILGAEVAHAYKPSPAAYDTAADMLQLPPHRCLMVAAHPADLAAAAARGFCTAYVHRPLERGPAVEIPRPARNAFGYHVDDLGALADIFGV